VFYSGSVTPHTKQHRQFQGHLDNKVASGAEGGEVVDLAEVVVSHLMTHLLHIAGRIMALQERLGDLDSGVGPQRVLRRDTWPDLGAIDNKSL